MDRTRPPYAPRTAPRDNDTFPVRRTRRAALVAAA
jgi:hypothetical protein